MENTSYEVYELLETVGELKEILNNTETDLTEVENLLSSIDESLGETNEYLCYISDTLTDLNTTANNTFDTLGSVFVLLCIGGIVVTLVKTFFTGCCISIGKHPQFA